MLWRRDGAAAPPAASRRSPSNSPRMRPRPRSSKRRACACAWSTHRSGSRLDTASPPRCGAGRCAGRGCAARAFRRCFLPGDCSPAALPPLACCAARGGPHGYPGGGDWCGARGLWYGGECGACARGAAGSCPRFRRSPGCCAICCCRCSGSMAGARQFVWRGNAMRVAGNLPAIFIRAPTAIHMAVARGRAAPACIIRIDMRPCLPEDAHGSRHRRPQGHRLRFEPRARPRLRVPARGGRLRGRGQRPRQGARPKARRPRSPRRPARR